MMTNAEVGEVVMAAINKRPIQVLTNEGVWVDADFDTSVVALLGCIKHGTVYRVKPDGKKESKPMKQITDEDARVLNEAYAYLNLFSPLISHGSQRDKVVADLQKLINRLTVNPTPAPKREVKYAVFPSAGGYDFLRASTQYRLALAPSVFGFLCYEYADLTRLDTPTCYRFRMIQNTNRRTTDVAKYVVFEE